MSTYSAPTTSYGPYGQIPPPGAGFGGYPGSDLGLPAYGDGSMASRGARFAARLIDGLVMLPWALVCGVVTGHIAPLHSYLTTDQYGNTVQSATWGSIGEFFLVDALLIAAGWVIYEAVFTNTWGRTLGKKAMHVQAWQIGTPAFQPLSPGAAITRSVVYNLLGCLIPLQLVNVLACTWTRHQQCWHDNAAKTVVLVKY